MRTPSAGLALLLALGAFGSGCASSRAERRADQASFRASMHEQRAARLEAENQQLRAAAAVQQFLFVQSLVAQVRAAPATASAAAVCEDAPPKPLIDTAGQTIPVLADEPAVRDIVARMEAMIGRPLRPQERVMVGHLLRRPRTIDASDPWVMQ